jgi:predicted secreted protein
VELKMRRRSSSKSARLDADAAIVAGLARAVSLGFTKPHDIAIAIQVALQNAGLKIVRQPMTPNAEVK